MPEEWKPITGYVGCYEASNRGRIRSLDRVNNYGRTVEGHLLSPKTDRYGYKQIALSRDGDRQWFTVHRLVALCFIECPGDPDDLEINHLNGNKCDNRVDNLEWCTRAENTRHAAANGLLKGTEGTLKGSCHPRAKLTEAQVFEARKRHATTNASYRDLARDYGVAPSVIGKAIKGDTWKNVSFPEVDE